jgi:aryl-alcohol dehydrogenase-like predicted oxidoreductase
LSVLPQARGLVRRGIAGEMSAGHLDVATLRVSLEASLRALRTEYVDVLLMHEAPEDAYLRDDLMAELAKVVEEGKARRVGVSTTGKGAGLAAMRGPEVLSVVQYPAMGINDWQRGAAREHMRLANHPLGGPVLAKRVGKALRAMARDERLDAGLRAKLDADAAELGAAYWFARAEIGSHPDSIVTSMLDLKHLKANVAAIERERFSAEDVQTIQRWIMMLRLIP